MVPTELIIEIFKHLASCGYDLINMPESPEGRPADAALVVQQNRVRYLFLVAVVDENRPYVATVNEQIDQYLL